MQVKAAVAHEPGKPLSIETVVLEGPKEGEVLVEIKATGMCQRSTTVYMLVEGEIPPYYTEADITTEPRDLFAKLLVAGITVGKREDGRRDVRITYRFGASQPSGGENTFADGLSTLRGYVCHAQTSRLSRLLP